MTSVHAIISLLPQLLDTRSLVELTLEKGQWQMSLFIWLVTFNSADICHWLPSKSPKSTRAIECRAVAIAWREVENVLWQLRMILSDKVSLCIMRIKEKAGFKSTNSLLCTQCTNHYTMLDWALWNWNTSRVNIASSDMGERYLTAETMPSDTVPPRFQ